MKNLILGLLLVVPGAFAANVPVTIKATADDDFIIMLNQGQSRTTVYTSTSDDWKIAKNAVIQIPDTDLGSCNIDFITWDRAWARRGLIASLSGNNGSTVHTGNPSWTSFHSTTLYGAYYPASPTFPTSAQIASLYSTLLPSNTNVYNGANIPWGTSASIGFDPAASWIASAQTLGYKSFHIHRLPCSSVVVKLNPPDQGKGPVDVKGDHFSCYTLEKSEALKPEMIEITDQFGKARAILGMPKMICNPSAKLHGKKNYPIEDKVRHLVCYEILEQRPMKDHGLTIRNQFEERKVKSTNRELFCVPSLKGHLKEKN